MDDIKASLSALIQKQGGVQNVKSALSSSNIPLDDHKAAVETAFREQIQSYSVSSSQTVDDSADTCTQLTRSSAPQFTDSKVSDEYHAGLLLRLEVLVELLKGELIQPNSVVPIVSDTLDIHTLSSATVIFNFLTDFMASDDSNVVKTTSTRNNLLKTSNELLRRASRTRNSELCGEILLFLTSIMPLTDRSATNFRGDIRESAKTIPDELMNSDEADDGYRNFWRLQAYLTNPMLIYNKTPVKDESKDEETSHTERFKDLFSYILQLLVEASDKEIKMSGSKSATGGGTKRKLNETEVQSDAYFFPEYLAQPKLFPLQVRHVVDHDSVVNSQLSLIGRRSKFQMLRVYTNVHHRAVYHLSATERAAERARDPESAGEDHQERHSIRPVTLRLGAEQARQHTPDAAQSISARHGCRCTYSAAHETRASLGILEDGELSYDRAPQCGHGAAR